ncbi:MAG TPA: glycosyltransferase family 39 protein [Chthoniobacterales bacterium]|nr:glycosyltransferase family 39 protein [Chthoniobacterales bacterium]
MSSKTWMLWLLIITVAVRLPTMFGVKRTGWDERAYVVFAQTLDKGGVSGIRQWMHDYPTTESLQKSPLLLRVGFIVPAMLTCKILGGFNVDNLAWLSFVCGVALVLVGAQFAENLAGRKVSILCGILLMTSPLAAGLSRRAMQDTFAALVFLTCLYFFDKCWRRRGLLAHASLGICLCLALLTKESALLLYPMMAIAAAYYYRAMKLRPSPWLLLPLVTAPLIYLLIEIGICGGIGNFIGTYRTYVSLQQTLDYTVHYEKGPWFRYLLDFLAIAPVVFIAAIIGFFARSDESILHGRNLSLIYFAGGILLFGQMPIVNVRLVLFIDMFLRLGAAAAIAYFAAQSGEKWSQRVFYLAIALLVVTDAWQFYQIFVIGNVYSPTTFLLLRAEGFYDIQP